MDPPSGTPAEPVPKLRLTAWSIIRATALLGLVVVVVQVVVAASTPLWWLAIAAVVAAVLQPFALVLQRWMPSAAAIALVAVATAGAIGWVGWRGISEVQLRIDELATTADAAAKDLEASDGFGDVASEIDLDGKVAAFFDGLPVALGGGDAADTITAAASGGGTALAIGMLVLLLMVFGQRFVVAGLHQIERDGVRARVATLLGAAYGRTARYVVLMAGRALLVGVTTTVVANLVGLPVPTAIGVWVALWSLVPAVGIVVASLGVALLALTVGAATAGGVLVVGVIVQVLDVAFVQAQVDRLSIRVGPGPTLIAAAVGLQLYGLGGMIVAVWLTVLVVAVVRQLVPLGDGPAAAFERVRPLPDGEAAVVLTGGSHRVES